MVDDEIRMWRRLTHGRARWVAATLVVAGVVVAACTSGGGHKQAASASTGGGPTAQPVRWWSNSLAVKGSVVDAADPAAVAVHLSVSASGYCSMLQQTLAAGRSIFPGAHAGDAALVTTTQAFLAEIGRVAPAAVAGDWATLAPSIEALVSGTALPANSSDQATRNRAAAAAISADAKRNCGLTLSH